MGMDRTSGGGAVIRPWIGIVALGITCSFGLRSRRLAEILSRARSSAPACSGGGDHAGDRSLLAGVTRYMIVAFQLPTPAVVTG
jgi:hypothetical protein